MNVSVCLHSPPAAFPRLGSLPAAIQQRLELTGGDAMTDDKDKVYPTGLTPAEAEDLHSYLIRGTRVFGAIALFAHFLAYQYSPWLK